jgi:hypothetical protein
MTRLSTSLTTLGAIAAALVVAAPAQAQSPDVVDRAVAQRQALESSPIVSPDAVDRLRAAVKRDTPIVSPDAIERAAAARADYGPNRSFDDRFNSASSVPAPIAVTTSDDSIQWPQLGLGLVLGAALALSLLFALRFARTRSLAH